MPIVSGDRAIQTGTFCGIDPGSHHVGLCAMTIAWEDLSIVAIEAQTYDSPIHLGICEPKAPMDRWDRIAHQQQRLVRALVHYQPWIVCCESPFYNRFRPGAYGALVECVAAIREAARQYDPTVRFTLYEPAVVKKTVGATAHGTKQAVKDRLSTIDEVTRHVEVLEWASYDEHSLDAIAVAYTHLLKMRRQRVEA